MITGNKRTMLVQTAVLAILASYVFPMAGDAALGSQREEAGRILKLQEVQRIADVQDGYYFKSPHDIKVAPDGSLFVVDEEQFLKFGADGSFIKNLYKKGQGPGELEGIGGFIFTDKTLVVLQRQPNKLLIMSHDGEFIREFRPETNADKIVTVHDGKYITARSTDPKLDKLGDEAMIIDVEWYLGYGSADRSVVEIEIQFPTRWFAKKIAGGRAIIANHIAEFTAKPYKDRYLVLCHTEEYGLKLFDLDSKQVVKEFARDYRRVRYQKPDKEGRIEIRPEVFNFAPPVEHLNDVQQVFIRGDYIWVMTSTIEPGKGLLFDVFNEQGEYVDHFYMPIQKSVKAEALEELPLTFRGDFVYIVEYDEDDIPTIVKYRMAPQK